MKGVGIDEIHICDFYCRIGCLYVSELFIVVDITFVIIDIVYNFWFMN